MNRLLGFFRFALSVFGCWFAFGILGMFLGLGLVALIGGGTLAWSVYLLGLVLALMTAVFAPRIHRALPGPEWLTRIIVVTFPLFFCGQLMVAGTPDWDPRPLFAGWVFGAGAAFVAWRRIRGAEVGLGDATA